VYFIINELIYFIGKIETETKLLKHLAKPLFIKSTPDGNFEDEDVPYLKNIKIQ
ncbi:hypothetical protein L9F63_000488, partial [Diploptera punctata]